MYRFRTQYPLLPMQLGMLFHEADNPAAGIYIAQVICTLESNLDSALFARAWQSVVAAHDAFRTSFERRGLDEPFQEIHPGATCLVEYIDWSSLSAVATEYKLAAFLVADRIRGFDLTTPPLMRVTQIQFPRDERILVWTSHHAILDGRSRLDILKQVGRLYRASQIGIVDESESSSSYREYLEWFHQQQWSENERYWRQLFNKPAYPKKWFSMTKTVSPHPEERFQSIAIRSVPQTKSLEQMANYCQVTDNTIIQAVWSFLIARYAEDDDVIFGTTRACRHIGPNKFEAVVCVRMNTVPVRVHVTSEATIKEFLSMLRSQHISVRPYENTPLNLVKEWSGVPYGTEIFETLVAFENRSLADATQVQAHPAWGSDVSRIVFAHYPLALIGNAKPTLSLQIDFDRWIFDVPYIERMAGHFAKLLEQVVENPERRIGELEMLSDGERQQILVEWNSTDHDYPNDKCVHELFEEQVERYPEAIAVVFKDDRLSYKELDQRVNRLAQHLRSVHGERAHIGIFLDRSIDMIVALLAVVKAGATCVPLDPIYPEVRLHFMMRDSGMSVILTQTHLRDKLAKQTVPVLCVDGDWQSAPREEGKKLVWKVAPEDLLYIIYTSGSTGQPKGIGVPHRVLVNLLAWHSRELRPAAKTLQYASLSFDASFHEIFSSLCTGGCLFLIEEDLRQDIGALASFIEEHAVEKIILPVVVLDQLAQEFLLRGSEPVELKELIVTGEQLQITKSIVEFFKRASCSLHNHYGPSETHVVTSLTLRGDPDKWPARPSIGRPIANTQIYLLDRFLHLVPIGVTGDLYIGGVSTTGQYWNRPELTSERFVPNPFPGHNGAVMYKTGDIARWLPDGTIEFIGRKDDQVKIRGYRVELGEIERVLLDNPHVGHAAVTIQEDGSDNKKLLAYIVTKSEIDLTSAQLRSYLKEKLPEYMVPSLVTILPTMPLTANGKIDYSALHMSANAEETNKSNYVAPRTETEKLLTIIWSEVLRASRIGIHDNFFDLGGHSLLAMQVINSIRELLQRSVTIRTIFHAPTISELQEYLYQNENFVGETEKIATIISQMMNEGNARRNVLGEHNG